MCIRDRDDGKYKNTWKDNKDELEKATKVFQFYKDLVDQGIIDPNCKNWGWEAVSYTHLDVYKRQVLSAAATDLCSAGNFLSP